MAALPGLPAWLIRRRAVLVAPARYCLPVEPASTQSRPARGTCGLLYCGLAAGPVFITTFLTEGAENLEVYEVALAGRLLAAGSP